MNTKPRKRRLLTTVAATGLLLAPMACSDDDDGDDVDTTNDTPTTAVDETTDDTTDDTNGTGGDDEGAAGNVVVVTMTDFAFDLPDELPAGTTLELVNESPVEVHEVVLFRLDDDEDRSLEELLELPQEELMAVAEMRGVGFAAPDSDDAVYPMGPLVLDEAGRWIALCAIPTGADPDEWLAEAAANPGPPDVDGGPPHLVHGMVSLVEVTD
ncbi:MAG: hypothetical protein JJU45_20020 [Acidimicrobiia bacterium]|nr:hypothetical protein [Acidimicrobiia bacterium]MCC5954382.1 hypothetical protein [Acidimicrobiia bacterium]